MEFRTFPSRLLGSPASFQRLMEAVMKGFVMSSFTLMTSWSIRRSIKIIDAFYNRFSDVWLDLTIKIRLEKCHFATRPVEYLRAFCPVLTKQPLSETQPCLTISTASDNLWGCVIFSKPVFVTLQSDLIHSQF